VKANKRAAMGFIFVTVLIVFIVFLPGAPFLAGSLLILISAVLAFRNMKKYADVPAV
jgi:uncharacterized membrane protein